MDYVQEKLIGGVMHERVECTKCGFLIWVNKFNGIPQCSDCNSIFRTKRESPSPADKAAGVDKRYHGNFQ